jgi:signal transduction histidine kinase
MKRVLVTGQPVCDVKITAKMPGRPGTGHWIANYFPIKDSRGKAKQVLGVVVEVTEQRKLEQSLHALTRKLLRARDEEQRRIARDLHDSINQYHAALKMNLVKLRRNNMDQVKRARLLAQSVELLDHCISETRTISYLLHPPLLDEMGFASATRWYAKGFAQRSGIKVHLNLPAKMDRLPVPVEIALFRVVQESLTNVHRHAHASTVRIDVERVHNEIMLKIQDNGRGIPAEVLGHLQETAGATGVGLASMNERVRELHGLLQLESHHGTTVLVRVPLSPELSFDGREETLSTVASS